MCERRGGSEVEEDAREGERGALTHKQRSSFFLIVRVSNGLRHLLWNLTLSFDRAVHLRRECECVGFLWVFSYKEYNDCFIECSEG